MSRRHPSPRRLAAACGTLALTLCALSTTVPAAADPDAPTAERPRALTLVRGPLTDLSPASAPTDGARATVAIARAGDYSRAWIVVAGLNPAATGRQYGVHVHTGPCVPGDGAAAGPHFNTDVAAGASQPEISPKTEVWLDITVNRTGRSYASTRVPFVVPPVGQGAGSIVIHEHPTDHVGMAGGRMACVPLLQD